jgi:hypothetical protein
MVEGRRNNWRIGWEEDGKAIAELLFENGDAALMDKNQLLLSHTVMGLGRYPASLW